MRSVGGAIWCDCQHGWAPAIVGRQTSTAWGRKAPAVKSLPTIVVPFERVRTSAGATLLVQPRGPTSCCVPGEPLVCRSWCWQQDPVCICSGATRLRARQQDLPPSVDEQQVPPQQQPEASREMLRQNGLNWPSGHRQSKWGTAVSNVMTAVSHAWPIQAFLPKEPIVFT